LFFDNSKLKIAILCFSQPFTLSLNLMTLPGGTPRGNSF
jgi:hypothetical protein